MLISVSEAAKVLGLKSRGSVYRKIKSGELPTTAGPDGLPMVERQDLEVVWQRITREQRNTPKTMVQRQRQPATASAPAPRSEDLPEYTISRARAEYEKANLLELDRRTRERQLLRREDVEQATGRAVNMARTKILGVPSRAKQQIPHLSADEVELIRDLLREALEELATMEVAA